MPDRLIFHVDVNSAFLSWEAARRVKLGEADLRLIPSAVGGDPEKRTGVILAKSIPAKRRGVVTGEPISSARRKCPELVLARPDFRLYETNSRAFMNICRRYAPVVEKFSIDECFLDMTGTNLIYPDPIRTAHEIKDRIKSELGFTVNIGIGPNKLLAKTASDFEKPDRVHTLFYPELAQKLHPLPIDELYSVGESTAAKLRAHGIDTIGRLAACPVEYVVSIIGDKFGRLLHNYANGIDDEPVTSEVSEAKGYNISTTLAEDVVDIETANRILLALSDSIAARMRADSFKAGCVTVSIRTSSFKNRSHQRRLSNATDITSEIYELAKRLFTELWDGHTPLRLIGLSLTGLTRGEVEQLSFFPDEVGDERRERSRLIDKTVDEIRGIYGSETIIRAAAYGVSRDIGKKYKARSDLNNNTDPKHGEQV